MNGAGPDLPEKTMAFERSFLFVPADRPERFVKALATRADRIIIDLEDAVAPTAKAAARDSLVNWLEGAHASDVMIRVNAATTPWHDDDLRAVAGLARVIGLMLPKAEDVEAIGATRAKFFGNKSLVGLVETVRGVADLRAVAGTPGLSRLAFGTVDFCLETGIEGQGPELDFVRTQLTLESCLAGLAAPIEGVTVDIRAVDVLETDIARARRYGFGGKLCIHPSQVDPINTGFSPSADSIGWARRVIDAAKSGGGAVTVDGKLVDRPIMLQAEKILARVSADAN
jgi:citrate lyase subunit beta / citryl-CoA lyase